MLTYQESKAPSHMVPWNDEYVHHPLSRESFEVQSVFTELVWRFKLSQKARANGIHKVGISRPGYQLEYEFVIEIVRSQRINCTLVTKPRRSLNTICTAKGVAVSERCRYRQIKTPRSVNPRNTWLLYQQG